MIAWLLHNAAAATLLALLALALRPFLQRRPDLMHILWLVVLGRLLWPPLGTDAERLPASATATAGVFTTQSGTLLDEGMRWMTRSFGGSWSVWLEGGLLGLWALGCLIVVVREVRAIARVQRLLRTARPAPPATVRRLGRVAARMGVRPPRLCVLPGAPAPFLWSVRRPLLVLPATRSGADATVLAHELAHLARRDHLWAWLELVACGLFWWNPLVWLARAAMRRNAELACDARVVATFPGRREAYARSLLAAASRIARGGQLPSPGLLGVVGSGVRELENRLRGILDGELPARWTRPLGLAVRAALVLGLAGAGFPGVIVPHGEALLPEYPRASSGSAVLDGYGVGSWDELRELAERALAADPGDGEAARRRGIALLGLRRHGEATEAFLQQAALGHRVPVAYYNAACARSLAGDADGALAHLRSALDAGFTNAAALRQDPDLAGCRGRPAFASLLAELEPGAPAP